MNSIVSKTRLRFFEWALRGKAPEASPVVLGQRRIFVLPTGAGLAYAVSLMLMLVGAINYNLSLGYATVFLLASLGITTIFHTFRNLAHLRITPGRCEPVFAGEPARFVLVLANSRSSGRVGIGLRLPGRPEVATDVPNGAATEVALDSPAPRRGWVALPRIRLSTTYPLGLIRAWAYAAPDIRCLVYPTPAAVAMQPPASGGEDGGNAGTNRRC